MSSLDFPSTIYQNSSCTNKTFTAGRAIKSLRWLLASMYSWENCHYPSRNWDESNTMEKPEIFAGNGPEPSPGKPELDSKTEKTKLINEGYTESIMPHVADLTPKQHPEVLREPFFKMRLALLGTIQKIKNLL